MTDTLTWRNILILIFGDWANLTAVIASNPRNVVAPRALDWLRSRSLGAATGLRWTENANEVLIGSNSARFIGFHQLFKIGLRVGLLSFHEILMVEYGSIAPGKMFPSSGLHYQRFNKKLKLTKQMHGWDGLFQLTFHYVSCTNVLAVKLGSSAFDRMPYTICTCWRAVIWSNCVLLFETAQMLCSGTGSQSCPAAVH